MLLTIVFMFFIILFCSLSIFLFWKNNTEKDVISSLTNVKKLDSTFDLSKDILEAFAAGELTLTEDELITTVNNYLAYCPSTAGFGFLIYVNMSSELTQQSRRLIYKILLKRLNVLSNKELKIALLMLVETLDKYILSSSSIPLNQLNEFLFFIKESLCTRGYNVTTAKMERWVNLLLKKEKFACLTKEIINLFQLTHFLNSLKNIGKIFIFFFLISLLTFTCFNLKSQAAISNNMLMVNMLPTPTRIPQVGTFSRATTVSVAAMQRIETVSSNAFVFVTKKQKVTSFISSRANKQVPEKMIVTEITPQQTPVQEIPATSFELYDSIQQLGGNPLKTEFLIVDADENKILGVDLINQDKQASKTFITNLTTFVQTLLSYSQNQNIQNLNINLLTYFQTNYERSHIFPENIGKLFGFRSDSTSADGSSTLLLPRNLHQAIDAVENWYIPAYNQNRTLSSVLTEKKNYIVNNVILTFNQPLPGVDFEVGSEMYNLYLAIVAARYESLASLEIKEIEDFFGPALDNISLDFYLAARATDSLGDAIKATNDQIVNLKNQLKTYKITQDAETLQDFSTKLNRVLGQSVKKFRSLTNDVPLFLGYLADESMSERQEGQPPLKALNDLEEKYQKLIPEVDKVLRDYIDFISNPIVKKVVQDDKKDELLKYYVEKKVTQLKQFKNLYKTDLTNKGFKSPFLNPTTDAKKRYVMEVLRVKALDDFRLGNFMRSNVILQSDLGKKARSTSVSAILSKSASMASPTTRSDRSPSDPKQLGKRSFIMEILSLEYNFKASQEIFTLTLQKAKAKDNVFIPLETNANKINTKQFNTSLNVKVANCPQLAITYNPPD